MLKLAGGYILLCALTPLHSYSAFMYICTHTLQSNSALTLCTQVFCTHTLHSHSVLIYSALHSHSALILSTHTQNSNSVLTLSTHTLHSYSALILCTHDPVFIHFALKDSALIDSVFISLRLQIPRLTCHLQFPDSVPAAVVALC